MSTLKTGVTMATAAALAVASMQESPKPVVRRKAGRFVGDYNAKKKRDKRKKEKKTRQRSRRK